MSNTEQAQKSKDKSIIQSIGYKEFSAICDEYKIVETATKELLELADSPDTNERVKVDIYKWIIEMNIGKPKQMNDINLSKDDDTINIVRTIFSNDSEQIKALENLKQELLSKGVSQEQIDQKLEETYKPFEDINTKSE